LQKEDLDYVERRILYVHSRISADTKEDAEDIYVSIAQGLQLYGTAIFPAKKGEGAYMGVAEDGVFIPAESNPVCRNEREREGESITHLPVVVI
jgi:hypothetical protein